LTLLFEVLLTCPATSMNIRFMGADISNHAGLGARAEACRLVVRKEKGLSEILQFITGALEIGQQIVVVAGPSWLKEVACGLGEKGLRPDLFLHSGRLVFLTAPDCLNELLRASDPLQRGPLQRHGAVMRWVTDWSWALSKGDGVNVIQDYQRRLHSFVRALNAISLCTVHGEEIERASLLAFLASHRRAARIVQPVPIWQHSAHA
jgi:hypothetical protein